MTEALDAWLRELPKAELHVHLEGTVTAAALARIAARNGMDLGSRDPFDCRDFASFLEAFVRAVRCLRRPQDLAEIATDYLGRAAGQGIRHVEFMFSPASLRLFAPELDLEATIREIYAACCQAQSAVGVSALLLLDLVRNLGEDAALQDLALALRCRGLGVVGIGLGGDERRFAAAGFARVFDKARAAGLHRTVHAGEAAGPQSVVDAATLLHAERIGHGVAAQGERAVLRMLKERGVAIDACLTSNFVTGAVPAREQHPLAEFIKSGIITTLSSDDPSFFHTSLVEEYAKAAAMGLRQLELAQVARNGFAASFATPARKRVLVDELDAYVRRRPA
ncbi:MAG: adenosine deaminase [Candidatus Eremiobacteraeota bacterium]|nr:adenosine deaminase [Candidatus Eremiobacteraeota bacterium]